MRLVDLHLHSNVKGSDGQLSPEGLIEYVHCYANDLGIADRDVAISLTDHNVVSGLVAARNKAISYGMRFIPGCEVMLYEDDYDLQIEILVYGKQERIFSEEFSRIIGQSARAVKRRVMLGIEKWRKEGLKIDGYDIFPTEEVYNELQCAELTNDYYFFVRYVKARIEEKLGKELAGDIATKIFYRQMREKDGQLYVEPEQCGFPDSESLLSVTKGIGLITSLAHPGEYEIGRDRLFSLMNKLVERGLDGFEVYSRKNPQKLINELQEFCNRNDLLASGGSDFHSADAEYKIGMYTSEKYIPYNVVFSRLVGI